MRKFFNENLAGHKMRFLGEMEALHPQTIMKVYNSDDVGTIGKDMIVALCRQIALLEEKNAQLTKEEENDYDYQELLSDSLGITQND